MFQSLFNFTVKLFNNCTLLWAKIKKKKGMVFYARSFHYYYHSFLSPMNMSIERINILQAWDLCWLVPVFSSEPLANLHPLLPTPYPRIQKARQKYLQLCGLLLEWMDLAEKVSWTASKSDICNLFTFILFHYIFQISELQLKVQSQHLSSSSDWTFCLYSAKNEGGRRMLMQ